MVHAYIWSLFFLRCLMYNEYLFGVTNKILRYYLFITADITKVTSTE